MTLALVRHGQSTGNIAGLIQGWIDAALTREGRAQAAAVGRRFSAEPVAAIHASTLARAFNTAEEIAAHHDLEVVAHPELREHHFGEAEGLSWADAAERWGLSGQNWRNRDELIPGIEPIDVFHRRVMTKVDELIDAHEGELAVAVVHGGVIGQVARHVFGIEAGAIPRLTVDNCSVTLLERIAGVIVMRSFNDRCHLESID